MKTRITTDGRALAQYKEFESIILSARFRAAYECSNRGDEVYSFQARGIRNSYLPRFWSRYKRRNGAGGYRLTFNSSCAFKA